jgi:prophage regulatory protein
MLRLPEVLAARRCGKSKLYYDIRQGRFPPPIKLGARLAVWPSTDVEAEQEALLAARDKAA